MTKAQKERYLELRGVVDLSGEQAGELEKLTQLALAEGLDLETLEPVDRSAMTEVEVSDIVKAAVEDQIFGLREEILDKVSQNATQDDIEKTVKKYAQEMDSDELVQKVAKAVPQSESLSKDDLTEAFSASIKNLRSPSRMEHPVEDNSNAPLIEIPFGKTVGNLTVADKQLHNILCGKAQNAEIPESSLRIAQTRGSMDLDKKVLATDAGGAGTGAAGDLVNRDLSSELQYRLYVESQLASAMQGSEIQMPSQPFDLPLITTRPAFVTRTEGAAAPAEATIGTGTITLDAKKLLGFVDYSYEVDEDAIVAILPLITSQLAAGAASALEEAILNSGCDTGFVAGTPETAFGNGINKVGIHANNRVLGGTDNLAKASTYVATMRGKLGAKGVSPSDLLLVVSTSGYNDLLQDANTLTADKIGASARILTGTAGSIYGIPIVISEHQGTLVNKTTGVGDGGTTVNGKRDAALIHLPSWKVGVRRGFTVETDSNKKTQVNSVVASFRRAFVEVDAGTTGNGSASSASFDV